MKSEDTSRWNGGTLGAGWVSGECGKHRERGAGERISFLEK
jgi:hypothetical protein